MISSLARSSLTNARFSWSSHWINTCNSSSKCSQLALPRFWSSYFKKKCLYKPKILFNKNLLFVYPSLILDHEPLFYSPYLLPIVLLSFLVDPKFVQQNWTIEIKKKNKNQMIKLEKFVVIFKKKINNTIE